GEAGVGEREGERNPWLGAEPAPTARTPPAPQSHAPPHATTLKAGGDARLTADVRHLDLGQRSRLRGPQLRIAVGSARPDSPQLVDEFFVGGAEAQRRAEVVSPRGEQAGVEPSLGRESSPGTAAAEGLRDRRDHADLA